MENQISTENQVIFNEIERLACETFKISTHEVKQKSNKNFIVKVRQIIYYFTAEKGKRLTRYTDQELAEKYNQNKYSVVYSVKTVKGYIQTDKSFAATVEVLEQKIEQSLNTLAAQ